jgi:hypothetical protein
MKLEELSALGWKDAEDYYRECDRKYGAAELKVLAITNLNDISTAVETDEFVDSLDQPSTAGKIPSRSGSYLRLGSKKMLADLNIDCIKPVNSPETL